MATLPYCDGDTLQALTLAAATLTKRVLEGSNIADDGVKLAAISDARQRLLENMRPKPLKHGR